MRANRNGQGTTGTSFVTDLQKSRLLFHFEKLPNRRLVGWHSDGPLSLGCEIPKKNGQWMFIKWSNTNFNILRLKFRDAPHVPAIMLQNYRSKAVSIHAARFLDMGSNITHSHIDTGCLSTEGFSSETNKGLILSWENLAQLLGAPLYCN